MLAALLAIAVAPTPVRAQETVEPQPRAALTAEDAERAGQLLTDLAGEDAQLAQLARDELVGLGSGLAPRIIEEIRRAPAGIYRDRLLEVLRSFVESWILDLQKTLSPEVVPEAATLGIGGLGATGVSVAQKRLGKSTDDATEEEKARQAQAAAAAHDALLASGLPVLRFLLDVPPLRSRECWIALQEIAREIYQAHADRVLAANDEQRAAMRTELLAVADLAAAALAAGVRDLREEVRVFHEATVREAVAGSIGQLGDADPERRARARERLYHLGELAGDDLARLAEQGDSPEVRYHARRLGRQVKYRLSTELYDRVGHTLDRYEELSFRERRTACLELERLGGELAVPTLRRIVVLEQSRDVRIFAAKSLLRLGDWFGREVLLREGIQGRLARESEVLVALYMDQGIKYLQIGKYELAIREFTMILKLQPKNDTALYNMACAYSLWNRVDEACDYLAKAVEHGFDDADHMERDTDLDNIRDDPRYKEIVRKLRLAAGESPEGGD